MPTFKSDEIDLTPTTKPKKGIAVSTELVAKLQTDIKSRLNQLITEFQEVKRGLETLQEGQAALESLEARVVMLEEARADQVAPTLDDAEIMALINDRLDTIQASLSALLSNSGSQKGIAGEFGKDLERLGASLHAAQHWADLGRSLVLELTRAEAVVRSLLKYNEEILQSTPNKLRVHLENSQHGLSIIGRMLDRLIQSQEKLEELGQDAYLETDLSQLGEKNVSDANACSEKRKSQFCNFVKQNVLPILDGVSDGLKNLEDHIDGWRKAHPKGKQQLDEWIDSYEEIHDKLIAALSKAGITVMDVQPGMELDFECHQPLMAEPDPSIPDEHVKELVRDGFFVQSPNGQPQVLRQAQVIAVKNHKEETGTILDEA